MLARAAQAGDSNLAAEAAAVLSKAAEMDPANGEIAWRHGTALIGARRPAEAVRELRRALTLLPQAQHFPVLRDLAVAHFFALDVPACLEELEEMERLRPGSAEGRYWRARVYREQGKTEEARREVAAGLRDHPDHTRLKQLAGELGP